MTAAVNREAEPRSILIVLPTWVGDFVMATPALRAIRTRFADARIVFLTEANLRDLVRGGDWMDECVAWPAKEKRSIVHREYREFVRDLRRQEFDWAVLLPNSFRSALIARLAGAKRRFGYDRDGRGWLLTDRIAVKNRRRGEHSRGEGDPPESPLSKGGGFGAQSRLGARGEQDPSTHGRPAAVDVELGGPRIWPGPNVAVRMGTHLPGKLGPYWPIPMVEYYADLVEAIGCQRSGDRLELFVTPDCEESLGRRLRETPVSPPPPHHGGSSTQRISDAPRQVCDLARGDECGGGLQSGTTQRPLVVLSPGAKFGASKCWPAESFAALADRLIEAHGATVLITCGPGEEPIAHQIADAMRQPAIIFDDPVLSLGELKALIRRSDLLICNDAGPRHFAKAFNVPVVTIFGPTHPDWTATSYPDERIVRMDVDCGPCHQKICPLGHHQCMTGIGPEIVYAAAAELLALRAAPAHEPVHG